jgi:hypothetical protein
MGREMRGKRLKLRTELKKSQAAEIHTSALVELRLSGQKAGPHNPPQMILSGHDSVFSYLDAALPCCACALISHSGFARGTLDPACWRRVG